MNEENERKNAVERQYKYIICRTHTHSHTQAYDVHENKCQTRKKLHVHTRGTVSAKKLK